MNPLSIVRYDKKEHGEELISVYRNIKYREFFRRLPAGWTKEEILDFENQSASQLYAAISNDSKVLVGFAMLGSFCNYGLYCQAGLVLKEEYQKTSIGLKNYSHYAIKALLQMVFGTTPLRKVKFKFLEKRKDIEHIFIKGGMVNRTEFKDDCIFDSEFADELEYSIYREFFLKTYKD